MILNEAALVGLLFVSVFLDLIQSKGEMDAPDVNNIMVKYIVK